MTSLVWIAIWCAQASGPCQLQAKAFETEVACLEFVGEKTGGNCWFNEKGMRHELRKQKGIVRGVSSDGSGAEQAKEQSKLGTQMHDVIIPYAIGKPK